MGTNVRWNPADEDTLRAQLAKGATMRACAEALGAGFTPNSCIGKAHRLGLNSSSRTVIARIAKVDRPKTLARPRTPATKPALVAIDRKLRGLPLFCRVTRANAQGPDPLRLPIIDLGPSMCRYVLDEGGCCGHRTGGGSWCPHHSTLVYAPTKRRAA